MAKNAETAQPAASLEMPHSGRNYGIDLLRVVAIFQVLMLHTLGRGNVLGSVGYGSAQYKFAWLLEMGAFGATDIFALISGYVSYTDKEKKVNFANYIVLWLQVLFYSVGVTLWFKLLHPDWVTPLDQIQMFFPVTFELYWYFTAYTGVFMLMPVLNAGVRHCSQRSARKLFVLMIAVFSFYATVSQRFMFSNGYSFPWILICYVLGALMKRGNIGGKMKAYQAGLGIVICWVITWAWKLYGPELSFWGLYVGKGHAEMYMAPSVLIGSIFYVIGFSKLRIPHKAEKVVSFFAAGSFAAYILNCHKFVYTNWLGYKFSYLGGRSLAEIALHSVGFSLLFLTGAVLLDHARSGLFRVLRVRKLADGIVSLARGRAGKGDLDA